MPYQIPPTTPEYISAITAQIVSLVTSNAFIATSLRLKQNNVQASLSGNPDPKKMTLQAGDRPYFTINEVSERITDRNQMKTFCNTRGPNGDIVIIKELMFAMVVEWDSLDQNQPNQFKTVFEAILLNDPTLGYTGIPIRVSGQFTASNEEKPSPLVTGRSRKILVQTIRFPVVVELHRANLTANAAYTGT